MDVGEEVGDPPLAFLDKRDWKKLAMISCEGPFCPSILLVGGGDPLGVFSTDSCFRKERKVRMCQENIKTYFLGIYSCQIIRRRRTQGTHDAWPTHLTRAVYCLLKCFKMTFIKDLFVFTYSSHRDMLRLWIMISISAKCMWFNRLTWLSDSSSGIASW